MISKYFGKDLQPEDIYHCPITAQADAMRLIIHEEQEKQIIKAVQNIGIEINKEDLVQALNNDRRRYEAAWKAGYEACKQEYREKLQIVCGLLYQIKKNIDMEDETE